jgi:kynurenine formamidase
MSLPAFDELPAIEPLGLRHAWGVLDENLGTLELATPALTAAAARLIETGEPYGLSLPLNEPDPPLFHREPLRHEIYRPARHSNDDFLDRFFLQSSSQWDGLRHVRCREFGFFGGVEPGETFTPGAGRLGIEHWARRGIVGRGVLLDVARHFAALGRTFDPLTGTEITAHDLADTASRQGVEVRQGDILCIRTGWIDAYRAAPLARRTALQQTPTFAGLRADEDTARRLWDWHVAAVATDNPAVEVVPGDAAVGSLHRRLIPCLGFVLGELLDYSALSARCAEESRWEFFFTAVPLNVPGGVGSPANAIALW